MTTATKPAPQATEQKPPKELYRGDVNLDQIEVVSNVRKNFDAKKLKELTDNVRAVGVLEPVLLRPIGKTADRYYLVAGERRLRASKEAGLKTIPARVLELDEAAALEIQAFENLHRADLSPVEMARACKMLLDAGKFSVEQLAQRMDKSTSYVYRAVHLLDLPKEILAKIESGELTPEHGHQILRVTVAEREQVFKEWASSWEYQNGENTAKHLAAHVERHVGVQLSSAPFAKDKPYGGKIACSSCPSNSGNQGLLFDGAVKGSCMNKQCFDEKLGVYREELIAKTKAKYPTALEITMQDGNHYVGHGATDGRWICKGDFTGNTPKGDYRLSINPDMRIQLWTPKPKESRKSSSRPGPTPSKADPQADFVREYVGNSILQALAAKSTKLGKKHLIQILEYFIDQDLIDASELVEKALGFGLEPGKMSESELSQAIILQMRADDPRCVDLGAIKDLGVDVAGVTKKAKVAAEKAWSEKQPVKK